MLTTDVVNSIINLCPTLNGAPLNQIIQINLLCIRKHSDPFPFFIYHLDSSCLPSGGEKLIDPMAFCFFL